MTVRKLFKCKRKNPNQKQLSVHALNYFFCSIQQLTENDFIRVISEALDVTVDDVRGELKKLTGKMRSNITCCVEYPYVDEYYRDTYYSLYSRKHSPINRYCFRISFFSSDVTEDNFFTIDMRGLYFGYAVLRPTPKRLLGYTFLSPLVFLKHDFSCCLCMKKSLIMGRKMSVYAFPFSGQDGEMVSCSETALIMLLDYFSRRYNQYSRLLPSEIAALQEPASSERELPTQGLDVGSIGHILQTCGLKVKIYQKKENDDEEFGCTEEEFIRLMSIYINSGFPLYACTKSHAMLVIGKINSLSDENLQVITMNDNERPYTTLNSIQSITEFLVPLSDKIYLDAERVDARAALKKIKKFIPTFYSSYNLDNYSERLYLTTSKAIKSHLVSLSSCNDTRILIACTPMPRFVWVNEMTEKVQGKKSLAENQVELLSVFDATACNVNYNYLIMALDNKHILVPESAKDNPQHKSYHLYKIDGINIKPYMNNLNGEHTKWEN